MADLDLYRDCPLCGRRAVAVDGPTKDICVSCQTTVDLAEFKRTGSHAGGERQYRPTE